MHTFSQHVKNTISKAKTKVNIMKALAGSSWGHEKETLTLTYKSICRSTLEYGLPVWGPAISETSWDKLQTVQNQALRIATGCHLMSNIDHLHQETKVLPLKAHSEMLTKQFLTACHLPGHPGHKHLGLPPPPRNLSHHHTLLDYEPEVAQLLPSVVDRPAYKTAIKELHTTTVSKVLQEYEVNNVLLHHPPSINPEELKLTRRERSSLAQLRSGYCKLLNSYLFRINGTPDICPLCLETPHNTHHLFDCRENPTTLTVLDLWTRPAEVANFLKLDEPD